MKPRSAHIIGIAGLGMTALAVYLKQLGWEVTGSDEGFYDPSKSYLEQAGIHFHTHYSAKNIPNQANLIIIGKHAKLTKENPEIAQAFASEKEILSMAEMWGRLGEQTENTVVVGSYGKSTCTALLAHCLIHAGKDPHYFIGAVPYHMALSHAGKNSVFIMEGDEYPSSNFDTTSKFLYFHAKNVLLTSGEHDHVNMFPTLEEYLQPYQKLLKDLDRNSICIAGIEHPHVAKLVQQTDAKVITYGMSSIATYYADAITYGDTTTFQLKKNNYIITELSTSLLGTYNIENIVGVSAMILENNWLSIDELQKGIASFQGLKRRLDLLTTKSSVKVFEGFGSSYTKAKTIVQALRLHFPDTRIHIVFEPHTFSWRDPAMQHWYKDVFLGSQSVIILQPPTKDGKDTAKQLSLQEIAEQVKKTIPETFSTTNPTDVLRLLNTKVQRDDIIVILSSGEAGGLTKSIPEWAEERWQ